ncbi:MAG: Ig-like domain-containing protein [Clostridiales bacterium]|nr:Ig-like domain-containing protein [Clostridiales bacterium]
MKIRKILTLMLAVLMAVSLVPLSALAEEAGAAYLEASLQKMLDDVWARLDAAEKSALDAGAERNSVTMAVYKAALNDELVDEASISSLTQKSFFFTVHGMACAYDYDARNYVLSDKPVPESEYVIVTGGTRANNAESLNVLLVGPYYGQDSSFTDQYKNEANSIAETTGGQLTILQSKGATGPAIAAACKNVGVVIYDSHGTQSGTSSYLCLTTNSGITTQDYNNGWAVSSGSAAFIDGRYIQHHIDEPLKNTFFWMAICEGMKKNGCGTTGNALIEAGAGCVYGYSQSVTFSGDYVYEETFWNEMKKGESVCDAIYTMKSVHGEPDPYGDAWPIVMSPVDPFPANPDGHQDVLCDWMLLDPGDHALESFSLTDEIVEVYETFSAIVTFDRVPDNANHYDLEWFSEDPLIATVSGNAKKVVVTGVSEGMATIGCTVSVDGEEIGKAYCTVRVNAIPTLNEMLNAEGGTLEFSNPSVSYPWTVSMIDGELVATSSNFHTANSSSSVQTTVSMKAGDKFSFKWKVSSEQDYDYLYFYVNNQQKSKISGETEWAEYTFTAQTDGDYTFKWTFKKDPYYDGVHDCGFLKDVKFAPIDHTLYGDADDNGEVTAADALLALRHSMEIIEFTPEQIARCDMDGDGLVTATDALIILRMSMGINVNADE